MKYIHIFYDCQNVCTLIPLIISGRKITFLGYCIYIKVKLIIIKIRILIYLKPKRY